MEAKIKMPRQVNRKSAGQVKNQKKKNSLAKIGGWRKIAGFLLLLCLIGSLPFFSHQALAQPKPASPIQINPNFDLNKTLASPQLTGTVQLMIALALISLIPFFLISVTSFIRIAVVLSMIRSAVGTQQVPPNPVIISLALFMTIFVMNPVWQKIDQAAYTPYRQGKITQEVAWSRAMVPLRDFMLKQTRQQDLALFVGFSKIPPIKTLDDVPTYVIIPAFTISELKTAFQIGFVIFLPFLVIDMVVANVLLSLGMFMLSPVMVSLPFKILLFVLADGWNIICRGLMSSFS